MDSGRMPIIAIFLVLFLVTPSALAQVYPKFAVVSENFAWGVHRSGILVSDGGLVFSFRGTNTATSWNWCDTDTITAYDEMTIFYSHGHLWSEDAYAHGFKRMVAAAEKAILVDLNPPTGTGAADIGSICFLYFQEVPDSNVRKRHLLAVNGVTRLEPSTPEAGKVERWLKEIYRTVNWTEVAIAKKKKVNP